MKKKINYMGLSELMRMSMVFVTCCLNLMEKGPARTQRQGMSDQFSLQSKGAVAVEDYWAECQYYDIVWVRFMFGNCNHCCFCCGHPCTMLGVSLLVSCKNKIQYVCVKKQTNKQTNKQKTLKDKQKLREVSTTKPA